MKLPKWVVICLIGLNLAATLAGTAWWWLSWPTWTMSEFIGHIEAQQFEEASRMMEGPLPSPYDGIEAMTQTDEPDRAVALAEDCWLTLSRESFEVKSRTPVDIVFGRCRFFLKGYYHTSDLDFTAELGKIRCRNPE